MEIFEDISLWINEHPVSSNIIKYIVWTIFILLTIAYLRRLLRKGLPDNAIRYKSQNHLNFMR